MDNFHFSRNDSIFHEERRSNQQIVRSSLKLLELELQRQRRSEAGDRDVAAAERVKGLSNAKKFDSQLVGSHEQARQSSLADLAKAQTKAMLHREELAEEVARFACTASRVR